MGHSTLCTRATEYLQQAQDHIDKGTEWDLSEALDLCGCASDLAWRSTVSAAIPIRKAARAKLNVVRSKLQALRAKKALGGQ